MKKLIVIAILVVCLFCSANSFAELITIGIEATVNSVSDYDNLLEGKVTVGSTITGTYTYDTSTPDTNPSTGSGEYVHYTSPCGIVLNLGDFVFSTDFDDVDFVVGIDNVNSGFLDRYSLSSRNNLSLYNGIEVDQLYLQLEDYSGTALSDTALPMTAPILSGWDYRKLGIGGGVGGTPPCYTYTFYIGAEVTSAWVVPEPMTLFLLCAGGLLIRAKRLT